MKTIYISAGLFLLFSCRSNEIANSKDVNPDAIYQEYNVYSENGEAKATLTAQFRFGGKNGTTLVLNDDSYISLDGKKLQVDSSGSMGAFYQTDLALPSAAGQHEFLFVDGKNKKYKNIIQLQPISLISKLPSTIGNESLVLNFSGLNKSDDIDIDIRDTSSSRKYRDVDTTVSSATGTITIPAASIRQLAPGPIRLEVRYEKTKNLDQSEREGGAINYIYLINKKLTKVRAGKK